MTRLALFALTKSGSKLALLIKELMPQGHLDVYLPASMETTLEINNKALNPQANYYHGSLRETVTANYCQYQGYVMIMALGIVVRTFAPLIKDKRTDPAVICLDEGGQFVISVLSGHLGGANQLTQEVAQLIGATPVITTATDVQGKLAFDLLAKKYQLDIQPIDKLKFLNGALVNGHKIAIYLDKTELPAQLVEEIEQLFPHDQVTVLPLTDINSSSTEIAKYCCIITAKDLSNELIGALASSQVLYLRPKNLNIGIGCRRGATSQEISTAIVKALALAQVSMASVKKIVSIDIKSDEEGLIQVAKELQLPISFISGELLQEICEQNQLTRSKFVQNAVGVECVCESAAIAGGKKAQLILGKTIYPKTTVAIAQEKSMWWE